LNNPDNRVSFKEATIAGQAADKGLFFPERIPALPEGFIDQLKHLSKEEIAYTVIAPYVGDSIPEEALRQIVAETVNFDIPLKLIHDGVYTLELFHGPTLAFKDTGARFMSRCLGYFMRSAQQKVTVLVATSGDTGGAVADGFYDVEGVDVVILYPSGKVSSVQEKQLTTLGKNITALEVAGTFDDCQQMVKSAFMDEALKQHLFLTSANSINVARWLPQQFYYFFALQQWQLAVPPVFCVPSGNFGNICAGLLAHASGLPVKHFIAACNENDVVTRYLASGNYEPLPAVATISNAMDVGSPSNFVRILEIFQQQFIALQQQLTSFRVDDTQTKLQLKSVYEQFGYLLDPHGAVGYEALQRYQQTVDAAPGIILETAHPVKFYDVVEPVIGEAVPIPEAIQTQLKKEKHSILMPAKFDELKAFLLSR
ncbi:MAG: hypothetical protein RLY16_305, partial [Bacteroidota bacterium]